MASSTEMYDYTSSSQYTTSSSSQYPEETYVDECDNVFVDENNFPEINTDQERLTGDEDIVAVKDQLVACDPWSEGGKGTVWKSHSTLKCYHVQ